MTPKIVRETYRQNLVVKKLFFFNEAVQEKF